MRRSSKYRLNANAVVHGTLKPLFATQVLFSGLNRDMSQQELNLLKLASSAMTKPGTRATKIMRCKLHKARLGGVLLDGMPDDFFCDAFAPRFTSFTHAAKYSSTVDTGRTAPFID
jgi:hypothetical protein